MNSEINYVSPFKKFCITIGNLPTSYLESMSYYDSLTFLVNYLANNVIPALNNNGEVVEELQNQFTILKNYVDSYFDNLDVQEEINNKLDEMADSGQLTDIIAQYLGLAGMITFNNVAEMKTANNLVNGSKCCTLGFYNINDGGNALYKIRTITNNDVVDERLIISLSDNTLIAELIHNGTVNIDQVGAKGDNLTDNSSLLNSILNDERINKITLTKNKIYVCNSKITINKSILLDGQMGTLKSTVSNDTGFEVEILPATGETVHDTKPYIITRVIFEGEDCSILFDNKQGYKGLITECYFYNFSGIGLKHTRGYETLYDTLRFIGKGQNGIGIYCNNNDVHFNNIFMRDCKTGIRLYCSSVYFDECHAWLLDTSLYEGSKFIEIYGQGTNYMNNIQADTYQYGIYFGAYGHIIANNYKVLFGQTPSTTLEDFSYCIYYTTNDLANYDWITNLKDVIVEGTNEKTKFSNITPQNSHINCDIIQTSDISYYEYNNNFYTLTAGSGCTIVRQEVTRDKENMVHLSATVKVTDATVGFKPILGFTYSIVPKTNFTAIGFASTSDYLTTTPQPIACYCSNNIQAYILTAGTQTIYFEATYLAKNDKKNV